MTELVRALYTYATQAQLACDAEDCRQYRESEQLMARHREALQELLNPDARQRLEKYLDEQTLLHDLELEATFCAGLSIGQELSRI